MRAAFLSTVLVLALVTSADFAKVSFNRNTTALLAINNSGVAGGSYFSRKGNQNGLVRTPDGQITPFAVDHSTGTLVTAINDDATVTGNYLDPATGVLAAFVRSADGHIQTYTIPGNVHGTTARDINAGGTITGLYRDADFVAHGYVRAPDGTIATFDVLHAVNGIYPRAINSTGVIAGRWQGERGHDHGFVRAADGTITSFDASRAGNHTDVAGIDSNGDIAGDFVDAAGAMHGYVRDADGTFHVFDAPGARATTPLGMSASGTVTGSYRDRDLKAHDFVRAPDGTIVEFTPRKGERSSMAWAVNDSREVAGQYASGKHYAKSFGFIGTPGTP